MNNEYIVINKTELLKRIENLEDERDGFIYNPNKTEERICYNSKIELLKQILSQSTPLIPETDLRKALWELGDVLFNNNQNGIKEGEPENYFNDIIQSLQQPTTQWDVEFDSQGKLKLKK